MPRPTPRQREVLEAMSDGSELRVLSIGGHVRVAGKVTDVTIGRMVANGWIKWAALTNHHCGVYVITEAGRRAVARTDGGV